MGADWRAALRVRGDTMATMAPPVVSPEMVGRTVQLGELRDALATSRDGHAVAVLVGGEAGAGKTRLVSEFAAGIRGDVRVHTGHCVELGSDGLAYTSLAGVIRSMIAEFGAEAVIGWAGAGSGALAALIPELELDDPAPDPGRGRLFEVITLILERAANEHSLAVVIEDLQWADGSTRDLLRFAVRALAEAPLLLLLTYRTDEINRTHPLRPLLAELDRLRSVRRVTIPRLARNDVAAQVASIWGRSVETDVVDRVFRRSEGLPFFVEELAGAEAGGAPTGLPDSLRDLLLVRIEQLSEQTQQLLRLVAVGQTGRVAHWQLAGASDLGAADLDEYLREAVSANVLQVDGDGYSFRHALLCEAVQDDTLPGESARLHLRFAAALAAQPDGNPGDPAASAMQLAYHLFAANDHAGAFRAYLAAADHAARTYAFPEALFALERVLELWSLVPDAADVAGADHATLLARTSERAKQAGELERALSLGEAATKEFGDDADIEVRTDLVLQRYRILSDLGRPLPESQLQTVLDSLPAEEAVWRARLLAVISSRRLMNGNFATGVAAATEAVALAESTGAHDTQLKALTLLGSAQVNLGEVDAGLAAFERARTIKSAPPGARLSYHVNASDALCLLGRYEEAAAIARAGIDDAREIGRARTLGAIILGNAAEPLLALGEWDLAERLIDRGLSLDPPVRHRWQLASLRVSLLLWRGEVAAAACEFGELQPLAASTAIDPQYSIPCARIGAELDLARGDADAAWDCVRKGLELPNVIPGYVLPLIGTGARVLGERRRTGSADDEAERWLRDKLDPIALHEPAPSWQTLVDAELATADQTTAWQRAAEAERLPAHLRAYATYRLGRSYVETGERTKATDALERAAGAARTIGAGLVVGYVDDLVRRAGLGDDTAQPGPVELTPREVEVLRLVAAGHSNRRIGEELFISAKTASVHVSNILAKLDVSTRGEAASYARTLAGEPR